MDRISLSKEYINFLSKSKTERECVSEITKIVKKKGYKSIDEILAKGEKLKTGDKFYVSRMNKTIAIFNIGENKLEEGLNIIVAHVDSPRIDIKQNPLYEKEKLVYLDTQYYGAIKKYHWVAIPLAIHGVVAKKNREIVQICIGERKDEPVFTISDLPIHLAKEQMDKKAMHLIEGEKLDVLVGNAWNIKDGNEAAKDNISALLCNRYGIKEDDFMSAELEIVPAGNAYEMGIDKNMILGYGHDDKAGVYTSLCALINANVKRTSCCIFVDKEEVGSYGATAIQSKFFENALAELINVSNEYNELSLRRSLSRSRVMSSDVTAAYDPLYADKFEKRNSAMLGKGVVIKKYTGAKGKRGANDTNAEYLAFIRNIMDKKNIKYQSAELGKVDAGGGGTISCFMSLYGMEVVDSGVPVLNMHAPWEIINKSDLYEAYKCYKAFFESYKLEN